METDYILQIKAPCSEDFNTFSKTKNGGFCNSCSKEVIDFTTASSEDIKRYFKNYTTTNTCGRFKSSQLNQEKNNSKFYGLISGIALTILALFTSNNLKAQTKTEVKKDTHNIKDLKNTITVKGIITESKVPLPGVNIILEGTATGTQTNFDGYFQFPKKLKKGDVLVVSYLGYKTKKITVTHEKSANNIELNVDLKSCDLILMGKVAPKNIYKSKKKH